MEVREVPIAAIKVSPGNVRKDLHAGTEDVGLAELAESIRERGLLSPVIVKPLPDGTYELIAGQRRLLACQRLGWTTIPALIREGTNDLDVVTISLVENVHRADLSPMDKARAFQKLYDRYGSLERVAKETGVSVTTVRKYLSLLRLAPGVQERVSTSEGPAGVEVLAKLAQTFPQEQHEEVLEKIGGFKRVVQLEIIKESKGDLERLEELRTRALEGAFDTRVCRGLHECPFIPPKARQLIQDALQQYQAHGDPEEFRRRIRELSRW